MTPSQESTGEPRGRALAIAILGLAALSLAVFIFIAFPKNEFKSKFSKIQLDMTEDEVDQLLDGHPKWRDDFNVAQTEAYGPPDGPCKRSPLFRKWYSEWPAIEGESYSIAVYFDENYMVVHKELSQAIK